MYLRVGQVVPISFRLSWQADAGGRVAGDPAVANGQRQDEGKHAVRLDRGARRSFGGEVRSPGLHAGVRDLVQRDATPPRKYKRTKQSRITLTGGRLQMPLRVQPGSRPVVEGDLAALRVAVRARLYCGRDSVQPCLRVDSPGEVPRVLAALSVAVPGPPPPVVPSRDAGHDRRPSRTRRAVRKGRGGR